MCHHVSSIEACDAVCRAQLSENGIILCDLSYFILCDLPEPLGARGDVCVGNLSTTSGDRLFRKL
jgi:hypothetical protein